jgi:prepilin-type N-terminal cleavage/methylation domain-containing protein
MRYRKEGQKGFTLIEILIVIVVMSILFGIGAKMISTTIYSWNIITLRKDMLLSSRMGMNRMVREIRLADTSKINIIYNPTDFQFTDIYNKFIRFRLDGTTLRRNSHILVDNLQNGNGLQFTYLDSNGNQAATASQIRRVRIRLNLQKGGQTLTFQSEARIRNT